MAKHNEVHLYGFLEREPEFVYDKNNEPLRCAFTVTTIRGAKDFGNDLSKVHLDRITVMSFRQDIVLLAKDLKPFNMVEIKGSFTTRNVAKKVTCPQCGHETKRLGSISFINPIFMCICEKTNNRADCEKLLRQKYELSNQATIIGMLCRDPEPFVTTSGLNITTYQMAVMRKYKVRETNSDNSVDFPWIKTYGKVAEADLKSLKKGSYVFIDGVIQARQIGRSIPCEACGADSPFKEVVCEIVPYAVEYLRGHYDADEAEKRAKSEDFPKNEVIDDEDLIDRPTELDDFDVDGFIDEHIGHTSAH